MESMGHIEGHTLELALLYQEKMGYKAKGCSSGSPRLTCSPLVSSTFGLGERVTFTHSSGPPPVSGHPEWDGDRSHLCHSALGRSFMRGPRT